MTWWDDAVGRSHEITRTFTVGDLEQWRSLAGWSGGAADDEAVPEPLIAGLFSKILGVDLPGRGSNYLKQQLEFPAQARLGEQLTARVEVVRVVPDKRLVYLSTTCLGSGERLVASGAALVLAGGIPRPATAGSIRPGT